MQYNCLVGFQILLLLCLERKIDYENDLHKKFSIIPHLLPSDKSNDKDAFLRKFSGPSTIKKWKQEHKQFIEISFTGDSMADNKKFKLVELLTLKYRYDSIHIIKVHFNNNTTYGEFVKLIDVMIILKNKRFMFWQDDFYMISNRLEDD